MKVTRGVIWNPSQVCGVPFIFNVGLDPLRVTIPFKVGLTFQSLAVSLRTARFNIQKFYMVLALRSLFCTDLRPDSDLCCIRH